MIPMLAMDAIRTVISLSIGAAVVLYVLAVWYDRKTKSRDEKEFLFYYGKMLAVHELAQAGDVDDEQVDDFTESQKQALRVMNSRSPKDWGSALSYIPALRHSFDHMSLLVLSRRRRAGESPSQEVERLARLRRAGAISDDEFRAFSERFRLTAGKKAMDVVEAISELYAQYQRGAMSEGNYHSGLWAMLDKLDQIKQS